MSQPNWETNIVDLLLNRAEQLPKQLVYKFLSDGETEDASLTYQQLAIQVRGIASYLQAMVTPQERALLLFPPGLEFITGFLGCLCAKVVPIPALPPRRNQRLERIMAILYDAQPSLVLTTDDLLEQVRSQLQRLALGHIRCLAIDPSFDGMAADWQQEEINPDTLAFLQYTSGSTGNPKGVMVSHANLLYNLLQIQTGFGHDYFSRGVIWLPPYHDMGLIGGILQPLFAGFPVVLMPPITFLQKPFRWLQAISNYRATTSGGPNFAYDLCVNRISTEQKSSLDLSSWKVAFNGSEPLRANTLQRFSEAFSDCGFRPNAFYPCYGMAETTLLVAGGNQKHAPVLKHVQTAALEDGKVVPLKGPQKGSQTLVGCGRGVLKQDIIIVDPKSQLQCPSDHIGEVWVAGKNVAQGYWNYKPETEATFAAYLSEPKLGPYLRTGDLGFLDSEGELFITGRLKELIIIRGRNYYPQDIEQVVEKSHPALRPHSGAAFSVEIKGQERLIIAHEIERGYLRKLNVAEISSSIRAVVSEEFGIEVYSVLLLKTNTLLKTSSGKIQRQGCRKAFLNKTLNILGHNEFSYNYDFIAPQTKLQILIANHFAEVLSLPPEKIGIHDNFFDLGGHSLLLVQIHNQLRQQFREDLSMLDLFRYPTIYTLAKYLEGHDQDEARHLDHSRENQLKTGKTRLAQRRHRRRSTRQP